MVLSSNINKYISQSKMNGRLCRWKKPIINVYITQIVSNIQNKDFYYFEVTRGIDVWNNILKSCSINLMFNIVQSPNLADVVIHWTKVGRVFEGMCKYPCVINDEIRKVSIDIGLYNEYSGKNTSDESIFFVILHELGHSLGLGHGVEIDDVMYVPHQKNVSKPSENDIYVLKQIYLSY